MTGCLGINVKYRNRSKELAWWQHNTAGMSDDENPWLIHVRPVPKNYWMDPWADFDVRNYISPVRSSTPADVSQVDSQDSVAPVKSVTEVH